jgi:hypothetical protein
MRGAVPPIPQYAFMAWCSVQAQTSLPLPLMVMVKLYLCTTREDVTSEDLNIKIYRSVILPAVLYKCDTWSLILRGEHRGCFKTGW